MTILMVILSVNKYTLGICMLQEQAVLTNEWRGHQVRHGVAHVGKPVGRRQLPFTKHLGQKDRRKGDERTGRERHHCAVGR